MNPFPLLLVLFLVIPAVEIYVLIKVGNLLGAIPTVFLVVFTAVLGALLLRQQGLSTLQRVQLSMMRGELPAMELLEGAVLLVSGALLLTPGFVTDTLGFLGLIPPVRRWLIRAFLRGGGGFPPAGPAAPGAERGPVTLEGEYTRDDD
ncbi:FxsA family protein [Thiohalobacter sp. IOR34]|uniref:FxsA family protein n=1 Tax=Thiohalobacter sp. IOR34 TaxID=3057176 RepID=UPI0025B0233C|nr:FxsA family protein [Thiohalobacter sp. IOR34]WJW75284.1 FxsA family protein [Thiohalobacter sp. IOR34]